MARSAVALDAGLGRISSASRDADSSSPAGERMRVRENEDEGEKRGRRERIAARARANRRRPRPRDPHKSLRAAPREARGGTDGAGWVTILWARLEWRMVAGEEAMEKAVRG